jgi:hypothetical protein
MAFFDGIKKMFGQQPEKEVPAADDLAAGTPAEQAQPSAAAAPPEPPAAQPESVAAENPAPEPVDNDYSAAEPVLKPAFNSAVSVPDDPGVFDVPGLVHAQRAGTIDLEGVEAEIVSAQNSGGQVSEMPGDQAAAVEKSAEPEELDEPEQKPLQAKITPMFELVSPAPVAEQPQPKQETREKAPAGRPRAKAARRAKTAPESGSIPRNRTYRQPSPEREVLPEPPRMEQPPLPVSAPPMPRRSSGIWIGVGLFFAVLVGAGLGAAGTAYWYQNGPQKNKAAQERIRAEKTIAALKVELENEKIADMNVRTGEKRLFELLNNVHQDWNRLPAKPDYFKVGKGAVVFWIDGLVWRQYYVYQGKGANGAMSRVNTNPEKRNFIYVKNLSKGLWHFSVSALNKEGKETPRSEELLIKSP